MWRLVHQWSFLLFWLSFDCFWLFLTIGTPLVHCCHSLGRPVTIGTQMVLSVFDDWYIQCTNRQIQSKDSQTAKTAEYTKPRKRRYLARPPLHVPGQWPQPVVRGQGWLYVSRWTSKSRPCVWLPFAAVCCYTLFYLLMMPACSSSSLSTTVIKFSIFSDPTRKLFLLSRPNSVEYGNSKTTTLLHSAKCTRPLFQGWTGCGGRLSGWHDIVTCQRLYLLLLLTMYWLRWHCHVNDIAGASYKIRQNKTNKRTEALTVSSRGQTL